jgi:uncharacterized protein (TIGR02246 family)
MTDKATGMVRIEDPKDAPKVCVHAFNAGDIDGLANLFEPEAVIIMPPGQTIRGHTEIREVFTQIPATWKRWEIKLISHHRVGDIALNTVEHTLYSDDPNGSPNTLSLRAAVVFRRQADGSWRFLIDNGAPFE